MRALLIAAVALAACGSDGDPDAAAIPCRNVCQADAVTCANACNGDGACRTACASDELTCLKVCEAQHPSDGAARCDGDCARFGATCANGCTDDACRAACTSSVDTCEQQCANQYP